MVWLAREASARLSEQSVAKDNDCARLRTEQHDTRVLAVSLWQRQRTKIKLKLDNVFVKFLSINTIFRFHLVWHSFLVVAMTSTTTYSYLAPDVAEALCRCLFTDIDDSDLRDHYSQYALFGYETRHLFGKTLYDTLSTDSLREAHQAPLSSQIPVKFKKAMMAATLISRINKQLLRNGPEHINQAMTSQLMQLDLEGCCLFYDEMMGALKYECQRHRLDDVTTMDAVSVNGSFDNLADNSKVKPIFDSNSHLIECDDGKRRFKRTWHYDNDDE